MKSGCIMHNLLLCDGFVSSVPAVVSVQLLRLRREQWCATDWMTQTSIQPVILEKGMDYYACLEYMSPLRRSTFWLTLPVLRPTSVRNCTSEMCNVHWRVSPWRMCTATCGSGFQSRRVECVHLHNNKSVPDLHCAWQRRPVTWQHCNITSCGSMFFFLISCCIIEF